MYIGRIVGVGMNEQGVLAAMYRVSSRSFPNRTAVIREDAISIVPKEGHEPDIQKNPYIAYNCARYPLDGQVAVLTNGSHTDPIAEKIALGLPVRDALALPLLALDYEKDQYNTPRIASVLDRRDQSAWLATVREDGLEVVRVLLGPGRCWYVATYEENRILSAQSDVFTAATPEEACSFVLSEGVFAEREHPVSAVAIVASPDGFQHATQDANAA